MKVGKGKKGGTGESWEAVSMKDACWGEKEGDKG